MNQDMVKDVKISQSAIYKNVVKKEEVASFRFFEN